MEIEFKYTYDGKDLGHIYLTFHPVSNKVTAAYTFSGDICHFPAEVTAWRPALNGFIDADEPQKVWEHVKAKPDKWKTKDKIPEGV